MTNNQTNNQTNQTDAYFAPLLPWQEQAWTQVAGQFNDGHLPHGLLAGGMAGIGKRLFVWRLVAWLLCQDKKSHVACQKCPSCIWLKAGTHPDLLVLPASSALGVCDDEADNIKIDDIRNLQDYSHIKGHGVRLMVLDNAETLTLPASNALLKTLEEPRAGIYLILISDNPAGLLPTIKSRVQALPLLQIRPEQALSYLGEYLEPKLAPMLLTLSDGAPLRARSLPEQAWFDKRLLWLRTLVALRQKTRPPVLASDYWQSQLSLADFLTLSRVMLVDVLRVYLGLPSLHTDIEVSAVLEQMSPPSLPATEKLIERLNDVAIAIHQNIQEKVAYDALMTALAEL